MKSLLDSRQLHAFVMLSCTGSFTLAAKNLFLTPSAVSHALKELEQRVGCLLLDRRRKKVVLTQAGEHLLHYAERILREMSDACSSLEHLGKWGVDRLRIAASAAFCEYILPDVLAEFYRDYPDSHLIIEPSDTLDAIELVRTGKVDLAITVEPKNERELEFHPFFTDELAFFVASSHPWAKAKQAIPAQISKQRWVLYKRNSYTFGLIEEYFLREKIVLNLMIELGSVDAIKEVVKRGLGAGILAPWVATREIADQSLVTLPLGARKLKRNWGIIYWHNRRLTWAEETFVNTCRSVIKKFAT